MSLLTSGAWRIGMVQLKVLEIKEVRGSPIGSKVNPIQGEAHVYQATVHSDAKLEIADITWKTGERDVRCLKCSRGTPEALQRLRRGLRLSVKHFDKDTLWVELRRARIDLNQGDDWSKLYKATIEELSKGAGVSVRQILERFGAEVDRREQLLGDTNRRRLYLCATFPANCDHLPAICYVLTRILPLARSKMDLAKPLPSEAAIQ
jgi:hypothetical protein